MGKSRATAYPESFYPESPPVRGGLLDAPLVVVVDVCILGDGCCDVSASLVCHCAHPPNLQQESKLSQPWRAIWDHAGRFLLHVYSPSLGFWYLVWDYLLGQQIDPVQLGVVSPPKLLWASFSLCGNNCVSKHVFFACVVEVPTKLYLASAWIYKSPSSVRFCFPVCLWSCLRPGIPAWICFLKFRHSNMDLFSVLHQAILAWTWTWTIYFLSVPVCQWEGPPPGNPASRPSRWIRAPCIRPRSAQSPRCSPSGPCSVCSLHKKIQNRSTRHV